MIGMKLARVGIVGIAVILILIGLGNVSGAQMSGKMLHVWDHSLQSSYYVYRGVKSKEYPISIQWDAYALNYTSGTQYVAIMAIVDSRGNAWGFFWKNGTVVIFSDTNDPSSDIPVYDTKIAGSSPHTYKIEVVYDSFGRISKINYYIDGQLVYEESWNTRRDISYIAAGGIFDGGKTFDLFIDNVVYTYGKGNLNKGKRKTVSEDFEDGQDDFFTWELKGANDGKSGAEVTYSSQVPEFPFLKPLFNYLSSIIGTG